MYFIYVDTYHAEHEDHADYEKVWVEGETIFLNIDHIVYIEYVGPYGKDSRMYRLYTSNSKYNFFYIAQGGFDKIKRELAKLNAMG